MTASLSPLDWANKLPDCNHENDTHAECFIVLSQAMEQARSDALTHAAALVERTHPHIAAVIQALLASDPYQAKAMAAVKSVCQTCLGTENLTPPAHVTEDFDCPDCGRHIQIKQDKAS